MSTKNKIIRAKSAKNTHVKTQSNSDSYASNLELTRYKLNQFYQSKFNEKRIKGELKYPEKTNNANTYFAKDSFIYEKLSSRPKNEEFINKMRNDTSKPYKFERDLFDNQYNERIKNFIERRKKYIMHFNVNYTLNSSTINNSTNTIESNHTVPMSYYRTYLTTEVPERKNCPNVHCSICGSKLDENVNHSQELSGVTDRSLYKKSFS